MQSLSSELFPPIPTDTAQAARSVLRRSNFYLVTGDQVHNLFSGLSLGDTMEWIRKPAQTQATLYLVTIFQFIEALPDYLAADALRMRVDWKYALHLPLNYPGLDESLFCKFRQWVLEDRIGEQNMQVLLSRLAKAVIEETDKQRLCLNVDKVVIDVCLLNQLANVWETIKQALEVIVTNRPDLLYGINLPYWHIRYGHQCRRLNSRVKREEVMALAQVIGADGLHLLKAISETGMPELANAPEVLALRQVWGDQYKWVEGKLTWNIAACVYCYLAFKNEVFDPKA